MKLTIGTKTLAEALKKLQPLTGGKTTLPVLACVLMTAADGLLKLAATNLDTGLEITLPCDGIEQEGALAVPCKLLLSVLGGMPAGEVLLERSGKDGTPMQVSAGDRKAKLYTMSAGEFPPLGSAGDTAEPVRMPVGLAGMLRRLLPAVAVNDGRYVLEGISCLSEGGKLSMFATDGRRLHLMETGHEYTGETFILPTEGAQLLAELAGDAECVARIGSSIEFSAEGWRLASKAIEGNPPNFRQVIPGESRVSVWLPRVQALSALDFASTMVSEKSASVRIDATETRARFTANTPDQGEAGAEVVLEKKGGAISIAFNPQFLRQVIKSSAEDVVHLEFVDPTLPLKMREGGFTAVLMPMRVS